MSVPSLRSIWHSPGSMNRMAVMLFTLSLLGMVALTAHWMANRSVFVVKRVVVDAARGELLHVSAPQVHAAISEALNGTVLSADLQAVHRALQSIPWVRTTTVRRIWPNRLLVRIEEQRAVATWTPGYLVNHLGEVFPGLAADSEQQCQLIPLAGPAGSERLVLERARQLSEWLAPMGRPLRALTLSDQYAWTAELEGGLVLELGRDSLATPAEERVRMFVKTQPWLARQLGASSSSAVMTRADLRYATGYAYVPAAVPSSAAATNESAAGTSPSASPLCIGVHA